MKKLFIFSLLITLVGCGSSKKAEKKPVGENFENLTNESFKWPKPKAYTTVDDFLGDKVTYDDDVLKSETLAKVPPKEIVDVDDVDKNLDRAIVACYRRDFNRADAIFDSLLKEYRKNPIYWNQVGNCFMVRGNSRKALLFFNKARELKGNYAPPVNNIGVIFQKDGKDQKAMKAYQEAKKLSSFSLTPVFNLAQVYAKYGFVDQGMALFDSLVRLNSKDQDSLYGLGYFQLAKGEISQAVNTFKNLDRSFRRKPEVAVNVAYALVLSNEKGDARDVLEDMSETNNSELNAYISQIRRLVQ
ncbi:MAG: hypothetical protein NXH75_12845 [Halobacteriovoraceae bacterium]|nr:hypothetical protein [Halobacteriovoraceae bacterium]